MKASANQDFYFLFIPLGPRYGRCQGFESFLIFVMQQIQFSGRGRTPHTPQCDFTCA